MLTGRTDAAYTPFHTARTKGADPFHAGKILRIQELPLLTEPLPNKKPSPRKTGQMAVVNGFAYIDYLRTFFRMIHEGTPRSRSRNVAEYTMAQDLLRYIGIEPSKHP